MASIIANKFTNKSLALAVVTLLFLSAGYFVAQATLMNTDGIIEPPQASIYTYYNTEQQAFNEVTGFTLPRDITCDSTTIPAGTIVDSHLVFLNYSGAGSFSRTKTWEFDNDIICVMSQKDGSYQLQTDDILGAEGTVYRTPDGDTIPYRGFELLGDSYEPKPISGETRNIFTNKITITMSADGSGDWVRIVTKSSPPPADTTPPVLSCDETTDPDAKGPANSQERYDLFVLKATDDTDTAVDIFLVDSVSGAVFGPFPSDTIVKYSLTNSPKSKIRYVKKDGVYTISAQGDATINATDSAGNIGTATCPVVTTP